MSWYEVESKIRLDDKEVRLYRQRIRKVAKFKEKLTKRDVYYSVSSRGYPNKAFRIRQAGNRYILNFKIWKSNLSERDVVVKREYEMDVDRNDFFIFLRDLKFRKWIEKTKHCEIYTYDNAQIELNYVENLGWFIEIEILSSGTDINLAKRRIRAIIKKLAIDKKKIDNTGYTKMLWKLGKNVSRNK